MARLVDPKNTISLTLANEEKTTDLTRFFIDHFFIDQFSQLLPLTLTVDEDLNQFRKYITKSSLITFSIWLCGFSSTSIKKLLPAILSCRLKNLIILDTCSWKLASFIVSYLTHLVNMNKPPDETLKQGRNRS